MGFFIIFFSIIILGLFIYIFHTSNNLKKCDIKIKELKETIKSLENEKKELKEQLTLEKIKREEEEVNHTRKYAEKNAKYGEEVEKRKNLQNEISNLERILRNQEQNEKHNKNKFHKRLEEENFKQKELEKKISNLEYIIACKEKKEEEERIQKRKEEEEQKSKGIKILGILTAIKDYKCKKEEDERIKKEREELEYARKREEEKKRLIKDALKKREREIELLEEHAKKVREESERLIGKFEQDFKSVAARIKKERKTGILGIEYYSYTITVNEDIELDKLFESLKDFGEWICYIKDLEDKNSLLQITKKHEWKIYLYDKGEEKIFKKGNYTKQAKDFLFCYLENRKIKRLENNLEHIIDNGLKQTSKLRKSGTTIEKRVCAALTSSKHDIIFKKQIECFKDSEMFIVEYELPNKSEIHNVKEYKYVQSTKEINIKKYSENEISKRFEDTLYAITLRSLYEIFFIDTKKELKVVTFNGYVTDISPSTGKTERKCVLSIQVDRVKFSKINLLQVDSKECFKSLKGVAASKLIEVSPVTPILTFNKNDRRFVEGKNVQTDQGTNLASMHWEDFEQLVRELFELEFAKNGGEVRVTQASRDGGVDAVIFDPDPLRGGKIVIQAKRYTNTVGVSAVRDLYGTVINEGANSGILITTSNYGHDSYEFAKDKPLKLLNGGHLLALLHKNGKNAHINIEEAKKSLVNNEKNSD